MMVERDCGCLHHEGPHWLHMDALWKQKNHELLEQAGRYEESGRASRDRGESMNLYVAFVSIMRLHAQEEMARLNEKLRHVEKKMIHKVRVVARATPEQLTRLQELGCDEEPYITFPSYSVYKAEMNAEVAEIMRSIECVTSVEKMPTYSV